MARHVGTVGRPLDVDVPPWPAAEVDRVVPAVTVTADVTSHTKGAWTEILAATTTNANFLVVDIGGMGASATDTRGLLDIGFGAAASETVVVANLNAGYTPVSQTNGAGIRTVIPLNVPKGTRISARLQSLISADTCTVSVATSSNGRSGPSTVDTYGADIAASNGVGTASTDTWVQVTASTSQAYQALSVCPATAVTSLLSWSTATCLTHVGIGAAGAEISLGSFQFATASTETTVIGSNGPLIYQHIPKGSRIAMKVATGSLTRGVIVLGIPYC